VGNSWADNLIGLGAFTLIFGAYLLFLKGPATNQPQLYFRIGVVSVGAVILVTGWIMRSTTRRS
jgi:hypothetical protein